jgi:hypothetical protein
MRRPRLSTCGQCSHDFSKNGLVTPRSTPALGGSLLTKREWSPSCIVKYGLISPAKGICICINVRPSISAYTSYHSRAAGGLEATILPGSCGLGRRRTPRLVRIGPSIPRLTINLLSTPRIAIAVGGIEVELLLESKPSSGR